MSLIASLALLGLLAANAPDEAAAVKSGFVPVAVPTLYYETAGQGEVIGFSMQRRPLVIAVARSADVGR